jgi:hypothetical protein
MSRQKWGSQIKEYFFLGHVEGNLGRCVKLWAYFDLPLRENTQTAVEIEHEEVRRGSMTRADQWIIPSVPLYLDWHEWPLCSLGL